MKSCWEFRKHAQIGESATKKDSCGQFEFLRLSCFGHLFGWGLFIQIPSPDFLLAFVWVGVGYGVHFKNWIQYPSFIHTDALFRLFSMNMTYIHVPNITCRFTTPHSGGPKKRHWAPQHLRNWSRHWCCQLTMSQTSNGLVQKLHINCHGVMVYQLLLTMVPGYPNLVPTTLAWLYQPQWHGTTISHLILHCGWDNPLGCWI